MKLPVVLACFLLWKGIEPLSVTDPGYHPNAMTGGTVVATLVVDKGSVTQVALLSGQEPFARSVSDALQTWRFPESVVHARLPVVVHFRSPHLRSASPSIMRIRPPRGSVRDRSLPYPVIVAEPAYPANALAQGSTVLLLEIDKGGNVSGVKTIKDLGSLTQSCAEAARRWKFSPAGDRQGRPVASTAFAVCVYRFPVLPTAPPR